VRAVRLWLDRRVAIPRPSNACAGFDPGVGWTFFDLNALHVRPQPLLCGIELGLGLEHQLELFST